MKARTSLRVRFNRWRGRQQALGIQRTLRAEQKHPRLRDLRRWSNRHPMALATMLGVTAAINARGFVPFIPVAAAIGGVVGHRIARRERKMWKKHGYGKHW